MLELVGRQSRHREEHRIDPAAERRTVPAAVERHIDPEVERHTVLEVVVHHIDPVEAVRRIGLVVAHRIGRVEEPHIVLGEEERHTVPGAEAHHTGLVVVRRTVPEAAGHSLAEAGSRPGEDIVDSALEVVVDSLAEEVGRSLGEGELKDINMRSP